MKKIVLKWAFLFFIVLTLALPCKAVQENNIIQSVEFHDSFMRILCADTGDRDRDYAVTLENDPVAVDLQELRSHQIPVTVLCLTDLSPSRNSENCAEFQKILQQISNRMKEKDNMILVASGQSPVFSEKLETHGEREKAIQAVAQGEDTGNLYENILACLSRIRGEQESGSFWCLVVLSDRKEEPKTGPGAEELTQAVRDSRIPVYTVLPDQEVQSKDMGKSLGRFSRNSYGGLHLIARGENNTGFSSNEINGDEVGGIIWRSIQNMDVLQVDIRDLPLDRKKNSVNLTVKYTLEGLSYSESMDIPVKEIPQIPVETDSSQKQETSRVSVQEDQVRYLPWIAVGVVLLAAVIVAVLFLKKKNARKTESPESAPIPAAESKEAVVAVPEEPAPRAPVHSYQVHLVDIPRGTNSLTFPIPEGEVVSLGRTGKAQILLNQEDSHLSSKSFSLNLQKEVYCIRDENSRNGTFLNGVRLAPGKWMKFSSGDKIRAGSYEYRITISGESDHR